MTTLGFATLTANLQRSGNAPPAIETRATHSQAHSRQGPQLAAARWPRRAYVGGVPRMIVSCSRKYMPANIFGSTE